MLLVNDGRSGRLSGILPAIASPCGERDIFLEDEFAALAVHLYEQGIDGLYVCGATGDGYNMRLNERKRAAEIAARLGKDYGGSTIIHIGSSSTRDAVELAEHAAQLGVKAISSMPPANRSHAQLISYYTDIARASELPLLVYHIPTLSGQMLTVDQMIALVDIDGVVGLKFSDWNLFFIKRVLAARPGISVFNGNDEFLCPGLLYGASGGIGMNYNIFPRLFVGIRDAVNRGDVEKAMQLQNLFLAYADVIWKYGLLPSFETIMRELGLATYCWRRPRMMIDRVTSEHLMSELRPLLDAIDGAVEE